MQSNGKTILFIFLILAFLAGIYVCLTNGIMNNGVKDGMDNKDSGLKPTDCPDLLIKKDNILLLYNKSAPEVDGINPLPFYSLDDYINYLEIQRKKGIHCPVLFLQQENDTQGNDVYRMRESPFYVEGGLPPLPVEIHDNSVPIPSLDASRANPPYNSNNYPGFDPYGRDIGRYTNIDKLHDSTMDENKTAASDNPMDPNWGGVMKTLQAVDSGKYVGNEVGKVIYPVFKPR